MKTLSCSWDSTHAVTSRGCDKLVVPEEKMADHDEQLSDDEKVNLLNNYRLNPTEKSWRPIFELQTLAPFGTYWRRSV